MTPLALLSVAALTLAYPPDEIDYLRDVKPILSAHCTVCHGALKQKGSLRADTAAFLRDGGSGGPAVVAGKPDASPLLDRVTGKPGVKRMPPESEGEPLKPAQVAVLRRWIEQGAPAPATEKAEADPKEHWAFKAPVRPAVPKVKNAGWVRNPIDAFIAAEHEKRGLVPQSAVERSLWLRRVYLDLIGLPPTREELESFLRDASAKPQAAEEAVVDKLLASPQYGERWGRHWMDVWRYSDWWGLGPELRNSQRHIWHWRDWIVESLNRDKGYDQMVREMLAADELYPTDTDALRGTGFLARHYFKFNRTTWLDETIEHTGKAFLGLTVNCSKCHDHKYDPISQVDYYRFRAVFEPYQVRLDQVPGESDYEKDGVPRAFDCNLDAPTFLHVRGNEAAIDKDRKITPGLPKFFGVAFEAKPITLPPEAVNPGLRPFVLQDQFKAADKQLAAARDRLTKAQQQLAAAEKKQEPKAPAKEAPKVLVQDDFATLKKDVWDVGPGTWQIENGRLVQKLDGANRAALSLKQPPPGDFEARVKLAILGGQTYHSVGVAFDVGGDNEALVYLTAHVGDQRVQFAYKQGGNYVYPPDARQPRTVPLNQAHEMTLRVRGSLLNVAINGQHAFAYNLPKGRHPGRLDLITYDSKARFESFTLATLPADLALVQAGNKPGVPMNAAQAKAAVVVAAKMIAAAEAQITSLKARAAADRDPKLAKDAAVAEKQHTVATAEVALALAEEKNDAAQIKQARAALDVARKALTTPGETYTPITGALKTLESNLETEASRRKPFPKTSTGRRTALAQWVAARDNPLTARVAVNHLWARHFGQPLVPTVFDLGRKGIPPTHPELLDWLAVEFMDNGWSMKHLHKLIVLSSAYRLSSSLAGAAPANRTADADNRYLWHMPPQRMGSQVVRDSLLHLAGELDLKLGGPSVEMAQQEASKRRSLYFFHSAIERNRFLTTFDEADPLDCYRRRESIVPQQALALSNSKLALSMSAKIAARFDAKLTDRDFARTAFLTLLAQTPGDDEVSACAEALGRWRELEKQRPDAVMRARAQLVQALLNHNDFVTIR